MGAPLNLRDWLWPELGASRQPGIARRLLPEYQAASVMAWLADNPNATMDGGSVTPTGAKLQNGLYGPAIGFFATLGQASTDRLTMPLVTTPEKTTLVLRYMQRSSTGDDYRLFDKGDGFLLGGSSPSVNYYSRPFSVSGGQWRFATPDYGEYVTIAIAHDASSASNTPLIAINGALLSLTLTATPSGTATTGGTNFILGNRSSGDRAIDGLIEFCVVLDRCLDLGQLLEASRDPMQLFEVGHDVFVSLAGSTSATVDGTQAGAAAQTGNVVANILAAGIQIGVAAQSGSIAGAPSPAGTQAGAGAQSLGLSNASSVGGTVSAVATQSGDLFVRAEVGGAQLAAALQSLALSYGSSVAGIMSGDGEQIGDLGLGLTVGGTQIAAALQSGGIAPDVRIAGVQIGAGSQSMGLAGDAATLGGTQAGAGAQSLVLNTVVRVSATQIADAILVGGLTVDVRIGAVQNGVAQIVGSVGGVVRVNGVVAGIGSQTGSLLAVITIVWPARRLASTNLQTARRPRQLQCRR